MRIPSTLLLLVSIFYLPTPPIIVHSQVLCIEKEKHALLDFKQSFVADPNDVLSTWRIDNHDCCNWQGIRCEDGTGHVTSLSIGNGLQSYRLRPSLLELQHLTLLSLEGNELRMRIPEFIGSFSKLTDLDLSYSGFYGKIPPQLGNLTLLGSLLLGDSASYLYVDDLQWLSHLSSLQLLELRYTNLSSATDWLSTLKMLPFLHTLDCSSCSFPPPPLSSISQVNSSSALQALYLSNSNMSFFALSCLINSTNKLDQLHVDNMDLEQNVHAFLEALIRRARYSLMKLDLSGNNLKQLPLEVLMKFPSLTSLRLSSNQLDKLSPQDIKFMSNLQELDISHNHIYMFPDLSPSSSLTVLDASFNRMSGNLQEVLHRLPTNLTSLDLSGNSMSGAISEARLSKFSHLYILRLSDNNLLTFNFNETWVPPFQLGELELRSCKLGPSFPNWILTQTRLYDLDISNTNISKAIPTAFWNFSTRLYNLNISFNNIKCLVPNLRLSFNEESNIDLSSNFLYGPIPPFLFTAPLLDLSNNRFSTFFPFHHKILRNQSRVINLSNNILSGVLPSWFFQLDRLVILNLANNMLSGTLPTEIGSLSNLITLHLNNNSFSGQLPPSMENCSHLKILELTSNHFSGAVPFWLGESLAQLVALNLRANQFSGELPSSLCLLQSLHVLDLSNNRISGSIPVCVHNFTSMATDKDLSLIFWGMSDDYCSDLNGYDTCLDSATVIWKGLLAQDYSRNLQQRNVIDLSNNRLTGQIPIGITTLKGLRSLNLSRNFLNESIPNKIGELKYLEVLMLSSNRLSGEIPNSLASLTFLAKLNLSDNNLCGRIPTSTQLQSFDPTSYAGNPKLCGKPLPNMCDEVRPPLGRNQHEEDGKPFDMQAFYAAVGIGYAFGFMGILGVLNFNAKWRLAFFGMASNITNWILVRTALCRSRIQRRLCF